MLTQLSSHLRLNSGSRMPILGLGTYLLFGESLRKALDYALFIGYRHIDTAHLYKNEKDIGNVLRDRCDNTSASLTQKIKRKDLFITTKLPSVYLAPADVSMCLEKSLDDLKQKYVDMFLIHHPWGMKNRRDGTLKPVNNRGERELQFYDLTDTWKSVESLVKSGKVRNIGVSNFTAGQIDKILSIARVPPSNLQCENHIYLQQPDLSRFCQSKNIVMTSYSSFGSPKRPNSSETEPSPLLEPVVWDISTKIGRTPAQVLLRNLIQKNVVVIPKSETQERILENSKIFDFELSDADMEKLKSLDRNFKYFPFTWARKHPEYFENEPF